MTGDSLYMRVLLTIIHLAQSRKTDAECSNEVNFA